MTRCKVCGRETTTSSVYCSLTCEASRYPYTHHGTPVHGNKLLDYLASENALREDHPELFEDEK